MLRPPSGADVAVVEFEDLECPACARAFPIVRNSAVRDNVPLVQYDFIVPSHTWSRTAAITARYLRDEYGPPIAEQFRRDLFAKQLYISNKEDLQKFSESWFRSHNLSTPDLVNLRGRLDGEIRADESLARRLGVDRTPTIIVVASKRWTEVDDPTQLDSIIARVRSERDEPPADGN